MTERAMSRIPAERTRFVLLAGLADHGVSTLRRSLLQATESVKTTDETCGTYIFAPEGDYNEQRSNNSMHMIHLLSQPPPTVSSAGEALPSYNNIFFSDDSVVASSPRPIMHLCDGALIVVDMVEGIAGHAGTVLTDLVLRCVVEEGMRPVIFFNKIDRCIAELQMDPEEVFATALRVITGINQRLESLECGVTIDPTTSVLFGSGKHGFAFSVQTFAKMYAAKFGVDESKMCERLWGDSFFDAKNKKWIKSEINADGERVKRAFCQFCLDPIYQLFDAVMNEKADTLDKMLEKLNVNLPSGDQEVGVIAKSYFDNSSSSSNPPFQQKLSQWCSIMRAWLPLGREVSHLVVDSMPSPTRVSPAAEPVRRR